MFVVLLNMSKYLIGRVLKPRGLRGELKVQILANFDNPYDRLTKVYIDGKIQTVTKVSIQNGFAYIMIDGVNTVEAAEEFRGLELFVTKAQLKLEPDDILVDSLVGFSVLNQKGKTLGKITSIEVFGERVIISCEKFDFPYEDDFVVSTNITDCTIVIRENMLVVEEVR